VATRDVRVADAAILQLDGAPGDGHLAEIEPGPRPARARPHHDESGLGPPQVLVRRTTDALAPRRGELRRGRLRQDRHPVGPVHALDGRRGPHGYFWAARRLAVSLRSRITWYLPSSAATKPPTEAPTSLKTSGLRLRMVVSDSWMADR